MFESHWPGVRGGGRVTAGGGEERPVPPPPPAPRLAAGMFLLQITPLSWRGFETVHRTDKFTVVKQAVFPAELQARDMDVRKGSGILVLLIYSPLYFRERLWGG